MKGFLSLFCLFVINIITFGQSANEARNMIASDYDLFLEWLPGEYDNFQQTVSDKNGGIIPPHFRLYAVIAKVNYPYLDGDMFYLQQYADNDPNKIIVQHLLETFYVKEENTIVMKKYSFPIGAAFRDIHLNPAKLNSVLPSNLKATENCEVHWIKKENHFLGTLEPTFCLSDDGSYGESVKLEKYFYLSENTFKYLVNVYNNLDTLVYGRSDKIPYSLNRINYYYATFKNVKNSSINNFNIQDVVLDDVGTLIPLVTQSGDTLNQAIKLSKGIFSNSGKPALKLELFIKEKNNFTPSIEVWADCNTDFIGLKSNSILIDVKRKLNK